MIDGWINKIHSTHAMKYYSILKKKEVLIYATMDESWEHYAKCISQSQKDEYYMILFIWGSESGQNHRNRKQNGGCQGLGGGLV